MKKKKNLSHYFVQLSTAWYADVVLKYADYVDELSLFVCDEAGNKKSDIVIRWKNIDGGLTPGISPRLEVFEDAWNCFLYFDDVLKLLARKAQTNRRMSVDDVMGYLIDAGFVDKTVREFKL